MTLQPSMSHEGPFLTNNKPHNLITETFLPNHSTGFTVKFKLLKYSLTQSRRWMQHNKVWSVFYSRYFSNPLCFNYIGQINEYTWKESLFSVRQYVHVTTLQNSKQTVYLFRTRYHNKKKKLYLVNTKKLNQVTGIADWIHSIQTRSQFHTN